MTVTINGTTGVSGVAGSASTPALIGSDADSGYYINSANEPNASVNGTAVWSAASTFGFKNRIINGNMVIDQRNAGAEVNPAVDGVYYVDRWNVASTAASKFKIGQNAGSVTPPAGFTKYLGATSLSSYSVSSGETFGIMQAVEGFNIADFGWGAAGAQAITLSFWVRSSLTGTFGGSVKNATAGATRSYPFSYTISSANTWEQKTVTIAGDTSGSWGTTNGTGLQLVFGLGTGSTYSGPANAWASANYWSPTGATSVVGTNGATFYITGVQLEKGSTATSFDYRPYGTELQLCQRYYIKISATSSGPILGLGAADSSTTSQHFGSLPVPMRSSPTYSFSSVNVSTITGSVYAVTGSNGINSDGLVYRVFFAVGGGGLTATTVPYFARANTTGYVDFSAEL